jgi:hypothetical protein
MIAKLSSPSDCVRTPSATVRTTSSAGQVTISPRANEAPASAASVGSTPIDLRADPRARSALAMPASRPPPPTQTSTLATSGRSSRISRPTLPGPRRSRGGRRAGPGWRPSSAARRAAVPSREALSLRSARPGAPGERAGDLDLRRAVRDDDRGRDAEAGGGAGDALGVVAARVGDDAARAHLGGEAGQEVAGAAQLERAGPLQVLGLGVDGRASAPGAPASAAAARAACGTRGGDAGGGGLEVGEGGRVMAGSTTRVASRRRAAPGRVSGAGGGPHARGTTFANRDPDARRAAPPIAGARRWPPPARVLGARNPWTTSAPPEQRQPRLRRGALPRLPRDPRRCPRRGAATSTARGGDGAGAPTRPEFPARHLFDPPGPTRRVRATRTGRAAAARRSGPERRRTAPAARPPDPQLPRPRPPRRRPQPARPRAPSRSPRSNRRSTASPRPTWSGRCSTPPSPAPRPCATCSRAAATYTRSIGAQFMHIDDLEVRMWLQARMERSRNRLELSRARRSCAS